MIRPGTSLKHAQPRKQPVPQGGTGLQIPKFEDFLGRGDWGGAAAILELEQQGSRENSALWSAYCAFHDGNYRKAQNIYDDLLKRHKGDKALTTNRALCRYAQGHVDEARAEALRAGESPLANRLLYLIAQKAGDETTMMACHARMSDNPADQLAVAAVHFLRGNFDDSIEIYKRLALQNKKYAALSVYTAMCYYRQEYYEIAAETLRGYLASQPDSIFANNLSACVVFHLRSGRDAEEELRRLEKRYEGGTLWEDQDLLRHNLAVFRRGENALKVFPPLMDEFPEARLNLVVHHLRSGEAEQAFRMLADFEPATARESVLKAVALAAYAEKKSLGDIQARAQKLFQSVGTSPQECDTVLGRQCIASFLILKRQYDDALVYLRTIREFLLGDDDFNWNYGMCLAATGQFVEAEEALLAVNSEAYRCEFAYAAWLARCHIANGRPHLAWSIYLDMDTSNETLTVLSLIGNECFSRGFYLFSFKAFDILERLDSEDHSAGKLAAGLGVLKDYLVTRSDDALEQLEEVLQVLRTSSHGSPRYEEIVKAIEEEVKE